MDAELSKSAFMQLEAEAIYVIREAYAQFQKPAILFSGGKDSIVLAHLAQKALAPLPFGFQLLHIDTGHNFTETLDFRDRFAQLLQAPLVVASVAQTIAAGKAQEGSGPFANRNRQQSVTLLETIQAHGFDALLGGGRRDEEKARAKERFFSRRNASGAWLPEQQAPELWRQLVGLHESGAHFRVFPLSNWTELDIWRYIASENIDLPSLYFAHQRPCIWRSGNWIALTEHIQLQESEVIEDKRVRFRTLGDATISGALESEAETVTEVIQELMLLTFSERGTRADDQFSDAAMEDRKKEGYF
ncbi:MAG: hypothetical protein RLZZ301_1879 [Bacteroidota bacterium]|jgi:sulfate adenylyltransferase subunit 2